MLSQAATSWHKCRCFCAAKPGCDFSSVLQAASARGANAAADAVAAPKGSFPSKPMPLGRAEPRKLLGNNRRLSSLSHAARACQPRETSCPHGGGLVQYRRGPWSQQRRRLRRKSAAVKLLGAAQQRAASSAPQTAAPRLWGRRAGPQDSPAHETAAQASISKHSPASPRIPSRQDGKCAHLIHQPRPLQGKESKNGGAVQAVRHHEL